MNEFQDWQEGISSMFLKIFCPKLLLKFFLRLLDHKTCWRNFFKNVHLTLRFFSGIAYEALCIHFCMRMSKIQVHFQVQKVWRFWTSWPSSKNFSEMKMIFNKFHLGLPPTKVNIDSELFSFGLTREMLTREMIKFCIHYIITRLYKTSRLGVWESVSNSPFSHFSNHNPSKMLLTQLLDFWSCWILVIQWILHLSSVSLWILMVGEPFY